MGEAHAAWMAPVFFGGSASVAGSAAQQVEIALADIGVRRRLGEQFNRPLQRGVHVTTLRTELFGEVDEIRRHDVEFAGSMRCASLPGAVLQRPGDVRRPQPGSARRPQVAGMGGDEHQLIRRHAEQVGAAEVGLRSGL